MGVVAAWQLTPIEERFIRAFRQEAQRSARGCCSLDWYHEHPSGILVVDLEIRSRHRARQEPVKDPIFQHVID